MKLVIENGVLKSCILSGREHEADLPETVTKIDDYAFAGNPKGQIRHLVLPDSLEHIAPRAFSGLDRLLSLTACTCGWDRPECRAVDIGGDGCDYLPGADTLILLHGKGGNFFAWGGLMNQEPRCLIMANDMDAGCCYEDRGKWRDGYISGIEELIVYIAPAAGPEGKAYLNGRLLKDMRGSLKKLRIVTDPFDCFTLRGARSWAAYRNKASWAWDPSLMRPDSFVEIDFGYIESLHALEELVLPEGLRIIGAGAFSDCESLKKVILPSTVFRIENDAFKNCRSLRQVAFCRDKMAAVGPGAFYGCGRLKSFSLYPENSILPGDEITHTIDAGEFLARGRILYFFHKVYIYIHRLSEMDTFRAYDSYLFKFDEYIRHEMDRLEEYGRSDTSFDEWLFRVRGTLSYGWNLLKTGLEHDSSAKVEEGLLKALETGVEGLKEYIMSQADELGSAVRPVRPDGKYNVRPVESEGG